MKCKLTFDIMEFEDGEISVMPKIEGTLTVNTMIMLICVLIKSAARYMSSLNILWQITKELWSGRYENMD